MVNKVLLIGNLAADPDVKATPNGMYVAKIRLATHSYAGKDESGNRKEHSEFHNVVAFGKLAEFAGQYMKKGRQFWVEGRLHTSSWEDNGRSGTAPRWSPRRSGSRATSRRRKRPNSKTAPG